MQVSNKLQAGWLKAPMGLWPPKFFCNKYVCYDHLYNAVLKLPIKEEIFMQILYHLVPRRFAHFALHALFTWPAGDLNVLFDLEAERPLTSSTVINPSMFCQRD